MQPTVMRIPVSQGNYASVDLEDYEKLVRYKWQIDHGYARGSKYIGKINGKYHTERFWMHRVIMDTPDGMQTDHINGDRLDNRRCNLRICTSQENGRNRKGVVGITYIHSRNKWRARIGMNYKRITLGEFSTKDEAIKVRKQAVDKYFGDFSPLKEIIR